MLDRKYLIENIDAVKANCRNRGMTVDVDRFVELEALRKTTQTDVDELNRKANEVSKSIGKAQDADEREARKEEGRHLRQQRDTAQQQLDEAMGEAEQIRQSIPNMAHPDAPIGEDDKANLEICRGQTPVPEFDFPPLDHVELGEKLDLIDFESGAKVAGAGFYFLKNDAVLLDLALQKFAIDLLVAEGFTPTVTPDLARTEILQGIGFNPRGEESQVYRVENTDLNLVGTAEITLGGMYAQEILAGEDLPIKLCGLSHCFRTEAGAAGRASRGLYRVHQFTKIEMFAFTRPEESEAMLDTLRDLECRIFDALGLAYRVVDTATGDLGAPAYRKFDLEAWMPGRGQDGEWGEVTSTSNCTDYQARRLGIRYKTKGEKGTRFVHTLNGTALAISRALVAILENYQEADGTIRVPEILQPLVGKARITEKRTL